MLHENLHLMLSNVVYNKNNTVLACCESVSMLTSTFTGGIKTIEDVSSPTKNSAVISIKCRCSYIYQKKNVYGRMDSKIDMRACVAIAH